MGRSDLDLPVAISESEKRIIGDYDYYRKTAEKL